MTNERLYEAIGEIGEKYIKEAGEYRSAQRPMWLKWGAMAACLCLIIAGAFASAKLWGASDKEQARMPAPELEGSVMQDAETGTTLEKIVTNSVIEDYTEPSPSTDPYFGDTNGIFLPDNSSEIINFKPMISSYGEMGTKVDMAVTDGGVHFSKALEAAMEEYGETVNYRVFVELFKDGVQISSGGSEAWQEAQRLSEFGYTPAMEMVTETQEHGEYVSATSTHYFTLHATYEQLKDFKASEELGYSLMLYDEYFGRAVSYDTVVFNGSEAAK